jgi:predicted permease
MTYAWGVGLFLDTERRNPVKRFFIHLLNPVFVSMCIGMTLGALGAKNWMPSLVLEFVGDLGGMYAPLSLLLTGYTIADYPLSEMFHLPKTYLFTGLRLLVFPLIAVILVKLVGGDLLMATMAVIAFSGISSFFKTISPIFISLRLLQSPQPCESRREKEYKKCANPPSDHKKEPIFFFL